MHNNQREGKHVEHGIPLLEELPAIELEGNRRIILTGRCVIVLYSPTEMRIHCGSLILTVSGMDLELQTLDAQELSICGWIASVGFEMEGRT